MNSVKVKGIDHDPLTAEQAELSRIYEAASAAYREKLGADRRIHIIQEEGFVGMTRRCYGAGLEAVANQSPIKIDYENALSRIDSMIRLADASTNKDNLLRAVVKEANRALMHQPDPAITNKPGPGKCNAAPRRSAWPRTPFTRFDGNGNYQP